MKIIIGGGSGFVGRMLVPALLRSGNDVTVIGRDKHKIQGIFHESVRAINWRDLPSMNASDFDAIINLTGTNIAEKRWRDSVKQDIIASRVNSVLTLIDWCKQSKGKMPHLYNASAIGCYGLQTSIPEKAQYYSEESNIAAINDHGFAYQVVTEWEAAARTADHAAIPLTLMRFGVVLHRGEGMLKQLELPAKCGMSAVLGTGAQPIAWISAEDLIAAIQHLLSHPEIIGVVNMVAPEVVSQQYFSQTLAKILNRPAILRMPAWLVRILFGQMGEELLLSGQAVQPARLLRDQFQFKHPALLDALTSEFA